jgi:hypothetical protein
MSRMVPLDPDVRDVLTKLPRRSEWVFARADGKPCDRDSFLPPLKRAAKRARIEKRIDIHTLRHSYGSNKIRQGWGLKKVSMLLGHSDIVITSKIYTHLLDGDLKVRDEFLFDKKGSVENSEESKGLEGQMADVLSQLMKMITQDHSGQITAELVKNALSAVREPARTNANAHQPAQTIRKEGSSVTQVLRQIQGTQKEKGLGVSSEASFPNHFTDLSGLKMACPAGVEPATFSSGG